MYNKFKLIFSLCVTLVILNGKTFAQTTATPKQDINQLVSITNADYNMGKIKSGAPLEYNVVVTNISKDTLSIKTVKVGCGCTTPKYKAGQIIQPGETATVTLGFNGSAVGPFFKFADIFFGNGLSKQLKFSGDAVKD